MKCVRLAMLSTEIRRDLHDPLRYFTQVDVLHFYRFASRDLAPGELAGTYRYSSPLNMYRQLQDASPDFVQGPEPLALVTLPYWLAAWRYAQRAQVPLVVVSVENRPLHSKYSRIGAAALRTLLSRYLRQADVIIYLNDGARANLVTCGAPSDRIIRLMYGAWGVDVNEFSPVGPRHVEPGCETVILYVGRLVAAKGIFDLVEAFARVAAKHPEAKLLMVGDGPDRKRVQERVLRLGVADRVRLVGPVLNRDLPPYFRSAAVFACPSIATRAWEEQVGMANLQAMACGVPVVSTQSGSIPEYVEDGRTGLLVPERSPEALAEALLSVLDRPELAAHLSLRGRQYVLEHYSAQQNIAKVEQLLLSTMLHRTQTATASDVGM